MKFRTDQAQEAYGAMCAEYARAIDEFISRIEMLVDEYPDEKVDLRFHIAQRAVEMRMRGLADAIRLANEVDMRWASLIGHFAMSGTEEC